jgi:hypothetical protein
MSHYLVDHAAQFATFKLSLKIAKAACPTSRATSPTSVKPQAQSRRSQVPTKRPRRPLKAASYCTSLGETPRRIGEKTLKV